MEIQKKGGGRWMGFFWGDSDGVVERCMGLNISVFWVRMVAPGKGKLSTSRL